jgi:hypothetical protein
MNNVRKVGLVGLPVLAMILVSYTSSGTPPTSSGVLPVTVTSVTATLTPYNPQLSSSGIPAEQVDFTVGGSPSGPFVCTIKVWRSGRLVASSPISANPPAGHPASFQESVPVSISGRTFAGKPSDAHVDCHMPS